MIYLLFILHLSAGFIIYPFKPQTESLTKLVINTQEHTNNYKWESIVIILELSESSLNLHSILFLDAEIDKIDIIDDTKLIKDPEYSYDKESYKIHASIEPQKTLNINEIIEYINKLTITLDKVGRIQNNNSKTILENNYTLFALKKGIVKTITSNFPTDQSGNTPKGEIGETCCDAFMLNLNSGIKILSSKHKGDNGFDRIYKLNKSLISMEAKLGVTRARYSMTKLFNLISLIFKNYKTKIDEISDIEKKDKATKTLNKLAIAFNSQTLYLMPFTVLPDTRIDVAIKKCSDKTTEGSEYLSQNDFMYSKQFLPVSERSPSPEAIAPANVPPQATTLSERLSQSSQRHNALIEKLLSLSPESALFKEIENLLINEPHNTGNVKLYYPNAANA